MLFLIVLTVATLGAALVDRRDRRTVARRGMAIALAVAGVAHLVTPTPFEQHLPGWMPSPTAVVVVTGVIEIALAVALLVAPGRPRSRARRSVGRLTAAYLAAVLPANVHVAVAGIDVDGQPGGVYPWLRIPFQAVFVAWVLFSTADDPSRRATDHLADLPYLRLPWAHGPARRPRITADRCSPDQAATDQVEAVRVAMASRLVLRRWRDVPAFIVAALGLRSLFRRTPGAIDLSLRAAPLGRTFWTLSTWDDDDALHRYARDEHHAAVTGRFRPAMASSVFAQWTTAATDRPSWSDARRRVRAAAPTDTTRTTTEEPMCESPN